MPRVSEIGLGCVTFGREIDRAAAFAMMDHAIGSGVTLFDTAAAYGDGASETIVGEWLARRALRERVVLATKILPPYSPAAIETAVDTSLQRLGVSHVDLLFLHRWDDRVAEPATVRALDVVLRSGRVRRLGASNFSVAQLDRALDLQARLGVARFSSLQNIHNFAVRSIDAPTRDLCRERDVSIFTYSPLGAGFLTGKHVHGVQPGSRFDLIPGHQGIYFNDLAQQRLARLKAAADRSGVPMTTLALAWALWQADVATVLVGGRSPAHLDQALKARAFTALGVLRELDTA